MGRKISWEDAARLGSVRKDTSIHAPQNRYGYRYNINHPGIRPMYELNKNRLGEKILSDKQRHHFELLLDQYFENQRRRQDV